MRLRSLLFVVGVVVSAAVSPVAAAGPYRVRI
jgi:hypothetical protein